MTNTTKQAHEWKPRFIALTGKVMMICQKTGETRDPTPEEIAAALQG